MRYNLQILTGILVLILAQLPLTAQEAENARKGRFRTLGCRINVEELHYAGIQDQGLVKQSGSEERSVRILDSTRSEFYELAGSRKLVFFRKTRVDGKLIREIVAEADMSKGGSLPLILFLPDPNKPELLRTLVVPDDAQSFPDTTFRFINLTPANLATTLGDSAFTLSPAGVELVRTGVQDKAETRLTTVSLANDKQVMRLYSNNWVVRPGQRTMVVIYPVNGTTEVHRITDTAKL